MCPHQVIDEDLALSPPRSRDERKPEDPDPDEPLSLHIYENEIPDFVEEQLEQLYGSIYCSLARIRLYDSVEGLCTFAATAGSKTSILILFRILGSAVQVINQQVQLSEEDIACFSGKIFSTYPGVRRIEFYALNTSIRSSRFRYLYQQVPQIEENIIVLPDSIDEYLRRLSTKTRTGIEKYTKKTTAAYPTYRFEIFQRNQITAELVRALVRLADMRMESKNKPSYLGADAIGKLTRLVRTHGYIATITIDGEICASNLCFHVGTRHFAQLLAHDPRYNAYALGHQINLQTILYCISRGAKEIWMMGGRSQEKSRFLTRRHFLNSIVIYRSRQAAVRSCLRFARNEVQKTVFSIKERALKKSVENNRAGRAVAQLLHLGRLMRCAPLQARQMLGAVLKGRSNAAAKE